jgi:hypothetical protein
VRLPLKDAVVAELELALGAVTRGETYYLGFLHIPAKRFNPGSRRQSGLGSDPVFSQFPNDFVHIHRL